MKHEIHFILIYYFLPIKPIQIGDSLVPDEFRIVKNVGVWPLRVEEQ